MRAIQKNHESGTHDNLIVRRSNPTGKVTETWHLRLQQNISTRVGKVILDYFADGRVDATE